MLSFILTVSKYSGTSLLSYHEFLTFEKGYTLLEISKFSLELKLSYGKNVSSDFNLILWNFWLRSLGFHWISIFVNINISTEFQVCWLEMYGEFNPYFLCNFLLTYIYIVHHYMCAQILNDYHQLSIHSESNYLLLAHWPVIF